MADAPRFCVDESVLFALSPDPNEAIAALEPLLQLGEVVVNHRGGPPEVVQGVYAIQSNISGRPFVDVLYQDLLEVDRDFVRRIGVFLDRCAPFAAERDDPIVAIVAVGAINSTVTSHACERLVSERTTGNHYYVLLQGSVPDLSGNGTITLGDQTVNAFVLHSAENLAKAYRQFVIDGTATEAEFFHICEEAFPSLIFHRSVTFKRFSKNYATLIADVVDHLAFLNDEFVALGIAERWDIYRMVSKARIPFSEETGNTRKKEKLVKYRRVAFGETRVECTLHTKISRQSDRIHFHAPDNKVAPGKVIIGVFAEHLPTK